MMLRSQTQMVLRSQTKLADTKAKSQSKSRRFSTMKKRKRNARSLPMCPKLMARADRDIKAAADYLRQVNESDGFDIDEDVVPKHSNMFRSYIPVDSHLIDAFNLSMAQFCEAALETFNRNNKIIDDEKNKFKFKQFAYATFTTAAHISFYLTFHATTDSGANNVFQALVVNRTKYYRGSPNIPEVDFCRIKAPPKVLNVQIVGDLVEGNTVRGTGHYIGGREGESKFQWFRLEETGYMEPLLSGIEYTLKEEDVGHGLAFKYSPLNSEGMQGESVFAYSAKVLPASPSVKNLRIVGELLEGNIVKGVGDFVGRNEGPSKFEWFRKNKYTGMLDLLSSVLMEYTLTRDDIDHRLVFKYTPINSDGLEGKSRSKTSNVVKKAPSVVTW